MENSNNATNRVQHVNTNERDGERDRTAATTQNLAVVAKDAILKATTKEKLDQCAEYLDKRYDENQIPREDYNSLSDLIKNRQEVIKT